MQFLSLKWRINSLSSVKSNLEKRGDLRSLANPKGIESSQPKVLSKIGTLKGKGSILTEDIDHRQHIGALKNQM
tara:strand:- start:90 stop:311 length:222 start_codon:yes stop_codon:yes gene_type:complete